jgi:hypothetical protein
MADQSKYIMNESELPKDLEFVDRAPTITGSGAAPTQSFDRYQGAILSAPLGLDTDIAKSQLPGANPAYRLMPTSIAGNPASNAAIQSTARKVIAVTPSPAPTPVASTITLNIPPIFTPITQTVTLPGPLAFSLATELPHTFLGAPIPGLTGLTSVSTNGHSPSPATNATITFTPPSSGWVLYMESLSGNSNNAPSGWTPWGDSAALSIASTSPITATDIVSTSLSWCNTAITFSGAIPTFIVNNQAIYSGGTTTKTASLTVTPSAGNFLIVSIYGFAGVGGSFTGFTLSSSKGDPLPQISVGAAGASAFNGPVTLHLFISPGVIGGSTTISSTISGTFPGGSNYTLSVTEVTPFAAGAGTPLFRLIDATDLPSLSAGNLSNGTTGTGAIVLAASPTLTGTLAAGSETLTGKITNYNGIGTLSNGIPAEYAAVDLTVQAAAITATTLYTVPAAGAGMYRISWVATVTQAATTSSVLGGTNGFQILYTDNDTSVVKTMPGQIVAGVDTNANNSTATGTISGCFIANAKASTNIQYQMDYSTLGATPMQYNLHIKLEAL